MFKPLPLFTVYTPAPKGRKTRNNPNKPTSKGVLKVSKKALSNLKKQKTGQKPTEITVSAKMQKQKKIQKRRGSEISASRKIQK